MTLERLISPTPGKPLVCLEINPPRGTDFEHIFKRLEGNTRGLDLLNVTDSALARMKCAPLPFAAALKSRLGVEVVVNISCRDRNLIALQGDLLAGWAMGIRSIVALTGDAVTIGDMPDGKGVFEVNSIGLLNAVAKLNSGVDLVGNPLKGAPQYLPGVVVNPNARNASAELRRLEKKKAAGARYALSQPVFDDKGAVEFFKSAASIGIPILVGLLALKNAQAAKHVVEFVPGIKIAPEVLATIADKDPQADLSEFFLEQCLKIADAARSYVAGFHIVTGANAALAMQLTGRVTDWVARL